MQHTIMSGEQETGVSIIDLDTRDFDAGFIWLQESCTIERYIDYRDLEDRMADLAASLSHRVLQDFDQYQAKPTNVF